MKYPKLKDTQNLSKKLTDSEITEIQEFFKKRSNTVSATSVRRFLADKYKVSYTTIYYWTNDKHRQEKRKKNSEYWSKIKLTDYPRWYEHKKAEITRRKNRMSRNPDLKTWNEVISAKNEKRTKRKTVKGKNLKDWLSEE